MIQKLGIFLQIFSLLRSKFFWILIILGVCLYFGYKKYGDQIVEKNPKLREIKNNIDSISEKAQDVKEKAQSAKDMADSIKKP